MTGQSNDAADRSASLIREPAQPADYANRVWPVLTTDDHLRNTLASYEWKRLHRGRDHTENPAEVLALEVVRLRAEVTSLRAELLEQGSWN